MAPIASENVYTKTAKGILEVRNKSVRLPRELGLVFLSIDGKTSIAELLPRSGMSAPQFHHAISNLVSDGYIKVVSTPARETPAAHEDEVDFATPQLATALNMEAASHALAAVDAAKRAQAHARAALDARMRVESEARARALAEARANAEAQARIVAEEAVRAAVNERTQAEMEASTAADAQERAQAEARARAAAAAAVRAEAEARVRAEAHARAQAEAETKRIAQEEALREAEARVLDEQQAQARAAAEERAREALEAQMHALDSARAQSHDAQTNDAEAARARVRALEQAAVEARAAAREIAEAEGRADEVAQPEMDIADRVRQLNARVSAERRAREEASRKPRTIPAESMAAAGQSGRGWPSLQLTDAAPSAHLDAIDLAIEPPQVIYDGRETAAQRAEENEFPVVDLDRTEPPPRTPEHEPTALERAMAQIARAQAQSQSQSQTASAPPVQGTHEEPATPPSYAPTAEAPAEIAEDAAPAPKIAPTIDDDEPLHERLNIDRTAHDIMAEEAEARRKAESAQFTRDAIDARHRRAGEKARKATLARSGERRRTMLTATGVALVVLPIAGAAWLQFATLDGYIPDAQRALAERFNQPVTISSLRYPLLPTPRLILENVSVGDSSVQAERIEARVMPLALLAGPSSFELVEVHGAEIDQRALGAIPAWTGGRSAGSIHTDRLRVTGLKLRLAGATLEPLAGEVEFAPNGTVRRATFANDNVKVLLTPQPDGARIELTATDWRIPYGPPFAWSHFQLRGLIDESYVAAAEFSGRVAGGSVEGALNARWIDAIDIRGDFSATGVRLQELARTLGSQFSATGTLKATGRFAMQAPEWSALTANAQLEAAFTGSRGQLVNIDLLRAVQSPTPGAMRGGRTPFEAFTGTLQMAGGRYALRQLALAAGPLGARGTIGIGPEGRLDGRITAELVTRGTRSTLLLGGTLKDPQLRR